MRITTQQGNIATQIGGAPPSPSAMWPGPLTSNRFQFAFWPDPGIDPQNDPNSYNIYRATGAGAPVKIASGIVAALTGGTTKHYFYTDRSVTAATAYTYTVTPVSPGQVEGAAGPQLPITTLANGPATPPTAVVDPSTWIVPIALPTAGTTWTCTNTTAGVIAGTGVLGNVGCSFAFALANANIHGGDVIILTAGATYATPPSGYALPQFDGTNGWTYIVSSEATIVKPTGILPPYTAAVPSPEFALTLTAIPVAGNTTATILSGPAAYVDGTGKWLKKTGIYPIRFSNAEQRYARFTLNSSVVDWSILNSAGTALNPNGWQGTTGPGLVANGTAFTAVITVEYLQGVTLFDTPAMPLIQFGGPGTSGLGITTHGGSANIRFIGIRVAPVPTNPTDNGQFLNFYCVEVSNNSSNSIYFDRCMIGDDTSSFTTSGSPNFTVTSTTHGFCLHGIGGVNCDNFLVHQCYLQGMNSPPSSVNQDAQAIFGLGGGPICVQGTYIEAGQEGCLYGGGFVQQAHHPHDFTYRYNFNTKPQWWEWGSQTLFLTNGPTLPARFIFGDYVKNLLELKAMQGGNVYSNVHWNCWFGRLPGYNGLSFTATVRDQPAANNPLFSTCPWVHVADIDYHDNVSRDVGQHTYIFDADYNPAVYTARIRHLNNQTFIRSWSSANATVFASVELDGLVVDIIIDHNTFVLDPTFCTNPGTTRCLWFANPAVFDRITFTNNIMPGINACFPTGVINNTSTTSVGNGACTNLTWANNLTIQDATGPFPAGTIYEAVPYASIGFQNWVNVNPPVTPVVASDWNVTGATIYATGSTTGGPIGAFLGNQIQITTASLQPATAGVAYSSALSVIGGTPPYTWNKVSIAPNTLLALTVSPAGLVQGTTQCNETSTVVVQVNDSGGASAQATLTVASSSSGALSVVTTTLPNYTQGGMYYGQLIASGGVAPYVWSGAPPTGVTIQRSGQITVDSSAAGPFSFTATVTDAANTSATSGTLTITVDTVLRFANVDPIDGFIRLPDGWAHTLYGQAKPRFMAFGGTGSYTFALASGSTNGLNVASDGSLSGTPASAGALNFTVQVTDTATHTATAQVLLNVLSQDKVTRPAYNTGSGYFVHSDGTFREPNGYRFNMRGMNRDHFDNACMPGMAVIGPNSVRYTAFTYGVSVPASTYEGGMNTDHIGNKEFVFLSGFYVVGTNTQLSGRSTPSDIQGLCNYYNQNIATFNPIMNQMGLNIANEWGTGNQSLSGNALFLQTYDGALVNITSISGTTINFTSAAPTNPLASQTFGWIQGVTGLTNQTVGLSGAAGTGPNYSITSSVSLGTFGAGGQLGGGAVCALRAGGWTCPIIIDECGRNGQNQGNILGGNAATVNGHDPQKNCIFNTHQYNVGTPGRAQITSVTTGATTVLHFNSSSPTNPFSNVGALPEIGITLIGMAGGTWASVNGQTFSISQGGGSFSGGAGTWAVTIPLNSTGLGAYTAGSGWAFDTYNPAITAKNFAALQAQGVCAMVEEFGPVTAVGPSPTILAPTDIIQACEAYGIGWFFWAYDDGNPFGLMTTLPAPNFAVSNLSTWAGQALVMHGRMNWAALAASPPVLLP